MSSSAMPASAVPSASSSTIHQTCSPAPSPCTCWVAFTSSSTPFRTCLMAEASSSRRASSASWASLVLAANARNVAPRASMRPRSASPNGWLLRDVIEKRRTTPVSMRTLRGSLIKTLHQFVKLVTYQADRCLTSIDFGCSHGSDLSRELHSSPQVRSLRGQSRRAPAGGGGRPTVQRGRPLDRRLPAGRPHAPGALSLCHGSARVGDRRTHARPGRRVRRRPLR